MNTQLETALQEARNAHHAEVHALRLAIDVLAHGDQRIEHQRRKVSHLEPGNEDYDSFVRWSNLMLEAQQIARDIAMQTPTIAAHTPMVEVVELLADYKETPR